MHALPSQISALFIIVLCLSGCLLALIGVPEVYLGNPEDAGEGLFLRKPDLLQPSFAAQQPSLVSLPDTPSSPQGSRLDILCWRRGRRAL